MKPYISAAALLLTLTGLFAQPPGGQVSTQNEYDKGHIKERSAKSHKKTDKITKHNNKVQDHANKQAEKERKEKLSGKKKETDAHQFPH